MPSQRELLLSTALAWLLLDAAGYLPPAYGGAATLRSLGAAAAPALAAALSLLSGLSTLLIPAGTPPLAVAAALLCIAAAAYTLLSPAAPSAVRVPELTPAPISSRRVSTTALSLASRPGLIQCYSPSTLQFLGEVPVTSGAGVRAVVARARALQPAWGATSFRERRRVLRTMSATILAHADEIVRLSCIDTGKPRVDAQFGEILSSLGKLAWVAAEGEAVLRPQARLTNLTSAHKAAAVEYHPLGVIGVVAPFNYPSTTS